jgi:alpha-2-macroglobulin-like protein
MYATGSSAAVETTGLAVQALLKANEGPGATRKALAYLASKKDASGAWGSTQATIMALRAVLLSTEKGAADTRGTVEITLNGTSVQSLTLTAENNDLLHQFVLPGDAKGANTVALRFSGQGGLAYQVAGKFFLPWDAHPANEPLSISVDYDRARMAQDDLATATATVRNNMTKAANMVMVDLGIPPGFDLLAEDLPVGGHLQKVSLTPTQAILYFDSLAAGETVTLKYRLRAKYPIRAQTFVSRVYEYYDPEVNSTARPVVLEVRGK